MRSSTSSCGSYRSARRRRSRHRAAVHGAARSWVPSCAGSAIELGAQTMHWGTHGAFTGEVSRADAAGGAGSTYVILGHSERRAYCDETDHTVNLKVTAALAAGITPIVAVGETSEQHAAGETIERVIAQTRRRSPGSTTTRSRAASSRTNRSGRSARGTPDTPEGANAVMGAIRGVVPRARRRARSCTAEA